MAQSKNNSANKRAKPKTQTKRNTQTKKKVTKRDSVRGRMEMTLIILSIIGTVFLGLAGYLISANHKSASVWFLFASLVTYSLLACLYLQDYIWKEDTKVAQQRTIETVQPNPTVVETERAYIGVKDLVLVEPLAVGKYPIVGTVFINGGKTPASDFATIYNAILSEEKCSEIKKTQALPDERIEGSAFIVAGAEKSGIFHATGLVITKQRLKNIESGKLKFYIFGKAFYKDFQGSEQIFPFFAEYQTFNGRFKECRD